MSSMLSTTSHFTTSSILLALIIEMTNTWTVAKTTYKNKINLYLGPSLASNKSRHEDQ